MKRQSIVLAAVALLAFLILNGCGSESKSAGSKADASKESSGKTEGAKNSMGQASAKTNKPVRLILTSFSAGHLPYYVAQREGYFEKEGLKLEATVIQSPSTTIQALQSNEGDLAYTGVAAFTSAVEKGAALVAIGTANNKAPFSLVVGKDIEDLKGLKGKSIAASTLQDTGTAMVEKMLGQVGLKKGDYSFIAAGGSPERASALESGKVDAVVLSPPYDFKLQSKGFKLLGRSNAPYEFLIYVARKKWLEENADQASAYLRAMGKAIDLMYEPANRNKIEQILIEETKISQEEAKLTYDLYMNELKIFPRDAKMSREGVQNTLDIAKALGTMKANLTVDNLIDERYWKQAFGGK